MEPDSTTNDPKGSINASKFPFNVHPENLALFNEASFNNTIGGTHEMQLLSWLKNVGLLPAKLTCSKKNPDCSNTLLCKPARVVDKLQWVCENCSSRIPLRQGSFFMKLQCSIYQALQVILAWCEDADWETIAEYFDIKPKVVCQIYDKLDKVAILEQRKLRLGGENSVVLVEMYPDCLNRRSPDTTVQPHVHRILMVADTNHIPTRYWLHVFQQDSKSTSEAVIQQKMRREVKEVLGRTTVPGSTLVLGPSVPSSDGTLSLQTLLQSCTNDMQHFLCDRIWRQAITLCSAARDLCASNVAAPDKCARAIQTYLDTALYRLRQTNGFYSEIITTIAENYTTH